jgi:hypothetical protein
MDAERARPRPATERVLARLPGERGLWIAAWALVPWVNAGANLLLGPESRTPVWEQSGAFVVLNYAALSLAVVITLWGADRIARRVEELPTRTSALRVDTTAPFREIGSLTGPLVAATATAVAFGIVTYLDDGWGPAAIRAATWFALGVAFWGFLWTYGALQLGLDRLGREPLRQNPGAADPTLGLAPVGNLAFTGLWLLLAWLVPVLLTALSDIVAVGIGAFVLAGALAAFFLSLARLHRRMIEVKTGEVAVARRLYAQAYEPVRGEQTLDALERQRGLLGAADALEKRAQAVHEWPIDERTVARVITIATSVVGITVARLILDPFGL